MSIRLPKTYTRIKVLEKLYLALEREAEMNDQKAWELLERVLRDFLGIYR